MEQGTTFKIVVMSNEDEERVVETRRFTLQECNIGRLYHALAYPGAVLSYQDREGDWISLRTDLDLDEMMRVCSSDNSNTYRLRCRKSNSSSSSPLLSDVAAKVGGAARRAAEEMAVLGVRATSYVEHKLNEIKTQEEEKEEKKVENQDKETKEGFVVCGEKKVDTIMMTPSAPNSNDVEIIAPVPQQQQQHSFSSRLAEAARTVAEEALVLTVRAGSYVEHQWNQSRHHDDDDDHDHDDDVDIHQIQKESDDVASSGGGVVVQEEEKKGRQREPIHVELNPSPPPSPVPSELEARVSDLVAMGFHDVDVNRAALLRHNLVLENAVADILGE